jgi:hypothetical protein
VAKLRSAMRGEARTSGAEEDLARAGWRAGSGLASGAWRIGCQVREELAREWRVYDEDLMESGVSLRAEVCW